MVAVAATRRSCGLLNVCAQKKKHLQGKRFLSPPHVIKSKKGN